MPINVTAACKGYLTHGCVRIATAGLWDSVIPRTQRLLFLEFLGCQILQISAVKQVCTYDYLLMCVPVCVFWRVVFPALLPGLVDMGRPCSAGGLSWAISIPDPSIISLFHRLLLLLLFCTHQGYLGLPAVLVRDAQGSRTRQYSSVSVLTHGLLYVCYVIE